jgi:hypothetical protein
MVNRYLHCIFSLLDPDPASESESGSTDPIESGSNSDPDLQPWLQVRYVGAGPPEIR